MPKQTNSYWDRIRKVIYVFLLALLLCTVTREPFYTFTDALKFGSLMSLSFFLILVPLFIGIDYVSLRRAFKKYGTVDYNVRQSREVKLDLPTHKAYASSVGAIKRLKGVKRIAENTDGREITAETGMNFMTFGEKIAVRIFQDDSEKTVVHIDSKPVMPFAAIDYGRNYTHVEKIAAFLRAKN